jgi:hypothetical protein
LACRHAGFPAIGPKNPVRSTMAARRMCQTGKKSAHRRSAISKLFHSCDSSLPQTDDTVAHHPWRWPVDGRRSCGIRVGLTPSPSLPLGPEIAIRTYSGRGSPNRDETWEREQNKRGKWRAEDEQDGRLSVFWAWFPPCCRNDDLPRTDVSMCSLHIPGQCNLLRSSWITN